MPPIARLWPTVRTAALAALCVASQGAQADDVSVAVASNFAAPMQQIAAAFAQDTGHRAVLSIGSTGKFYAQIRHGAPFEVLLAADSDTPQRLLQAGAALPGSRVRYAVGRLVLWSRTPGVVDAQGGVLATGQFARIALADPRVAPYGRAALQVMDRLGVVQRLRPRFVQGESIAQAYQFVASGGATLGFVARSQVGTNPALGSAWLVPAHLHDPIAQDAVALLPGQHKPAVGALLAYLQGDQARAIIRAHGYETPG